VTRSKAAAGRQKGMPARRPYTTPVWKNRWRDALPLACTRVSQKHPYATHASYNNGVDGTLILYERQIQEGRKLGIFDKFCKRSTVVKNTINTVYKIENGLWKRSG
jgi:hypothetical protein